MRILQLKSRKLRDKRPGAKGGWTMRALTIRLLDDRHAAQMSHETNVQTLSQPLRNATESTQGCPGGTRFNATNDALVNARGLRELALGKTSGKTRLYDSLSGKEFGLTRLPFRAKSWILQLLF